MKVLIFSLVLIVTLAQGLAFAAPQNCTAEVGIPLNIVVDMKAKTLQTPETGILNSCKVVTLTKYDIQDLRNFLRLPIGKEFQAEYEGIQKKIESGVNLSDEEKKFVAEVAMFLEKAAKMKVGEPLLKCPNGDTPVGVTWGKDLKTIDLYTTDWDILESWPLTCEDVAQPVDPKK